MARSKPQQKQYKPDTGGMTRKEIRRGRVMRREQRKAERAAERKMKKMTLANVDEAGETPGGGEAANSMPKMKRRSRKAKVQTVIDNRTKMPSIIRDQQLPSLGPVLCQDSTITVTREQWQVLATAVKEGSEYKDKYEALSKESQSHKSKLENSLASARDEVLGLRRLLMQTKVDFDEMDVAMAAQAAKMEAGRSF